MATDIMAETIRHKRSLFGDENEDVSNSSSNNFTTPNANVIKKRRNDTNTHNTTVLDRRVSTNISSTATPCDEVQSIQKVSL